MRRPAWLTRPVAILAVAEAVSSSGSWLTAMAVIHILVLSGGGGVAESSGIMLAWLLPLLVASPLAGRLADRYDRRLLMVASELFAGLAVVLLLFARTPVQFYALLAVQAAVGALLRPARLAAVRSLVPEADLARANAFLNQVSSVVKVAAPALGGSLVALVGARPAMALDVVSYLVSAALLATLPRLLPAAAAARPAVGPGAAAEAGAAAGPAAGPANRPGSALTDLLRIPGLRLLAAAGFLSVLVVSGLDLLLAVYVKEDLGGGSVLLGLMIAGIGGGALASGGWLMLRRRAGNTWTDLRLGVLLLAALILAMASGSALGPGPAAVGLVLAGALVGGVGNGLVQVQSITLVQELSPPERLGGVAGVIEATVVSGRVLAFLVIPLFVPAALSMGRFFALGGTGLVLLVLALAWLAPQPAARPAPVP